MLKKELFFLAAAATLLVIGVSYGAEPEANNFRGVVTYHLVPAKVMRVNEIVKNPEPGTSYIGDEGILVKLDRDMDVRANSTVVEVEYYEYDEPKTVQYELLGEEHEITVNYHAVRVVVDGDISEYIQEQ